MMRSIILALFSLVSGQFEVWEHDKGYDGYAPALLNVAEVLLRDLIANGEVQVPAKIPESDSEPAVEPVPEPRNTEVIRLDSYDELNKKPWYKRFWKFIRSALRLD
ncbi:hypothetical protein GNI_099280 [Gregarina niphandrodes]|uniref:Transmembrane protein n=1 Tax=Gregarina niphandrodes TaxID=110365 RepID=A0A023B4N7_GRENI|nr:hypothetical protein GNI_099280 [Gregarina niphandrodes]EZG57141.1 hypothetical protein GNI_099280 [Gregarina niphandrodes]|eukprot:XP_011131100.1 hypothetical protein GNI_099280 [Gregarina niphandrodes]